MTDEIKTIVWKPGDPITREAITENKSINGFLDVPRLVDDTIDGRACDKQGLRFLCVLADMLRQQFADRFCYLEIGVAYGSSLCAISYHKFKAAYEKYAGIDIFSGRLPGDVDPVPLTIERADRNIRYFGVQNFALFEGNSADEKIFKRVRAYLRDTVHLLYVDGEHSYDGVVNDFKNYGQLIEPGGAVFFGDYHYNECPGVTEAIDEIAGLESTADDWEIIGPLKIDGTPTPFVMIRKDG